MERSTTVLTLAGVATLASCTFPPLSPTLVEHFLGQRRSGAQEVPVQRVQSAPGGNAEDKLERN